MIRAVPETALSFCAPGMARSARNGAGNSKAKAEEEVTSSVSQKFCI